MGLDPEPPANAALHRRSQREGLLLIVDGGVGKAGPDLEPLIDRVVERIEPGDRHRGMACRVTEASSQREVHLRLERLKGTLEEAERAAPPGLVEPYPQEVALDRGRVLLVEPHRYGPAAAQFHGCLDLESGDEVLVIDAAGPVPGATRAPLPGILVHEAVAGGDVVQPVLGVDAPMEPLQNATIVESATVGGAAVEQEQPVGFAPAPERCVQRGRVGTCRRCGCGGLLLSQHRGRKHEEPEHRYARLCDASRVQPGGLIHCRDTSAQHKSLRTLQSHGTKKEGGHAPVGAPYHAVIRRYGGL